MAIDTASLFNDLRDFYKYEATSIQEVVGGTVGYTYSIDDKYFLKVYDTNLAMTAKCIENLENQLTVLDILQKKSLLKDRICYPMTTSNDQYFYSYENIIGVLFNYIDGSAIGFGNKYTLCDVEQISEIVKTLHNIDSSFFKNYCLQENFNLEWLQKLEFIIHNNLVQLPDDFQKISFDNSKIILSKIQELIELANELKLQQLPFVLCHTDIHGGNLMRDKNDKLYLVDWENIILAPKESDLFLFAENEQFNQITNNANQKALYFYIIRRDLEDIFEFLSALLNDEYSNKEKEEVKLHFKRITQHLLCAK